LDVDVERMGDNVGMLSASDIGALVDPSGSIGTSDALVERALASYHGGG
jgi:hypothetical protein